MITVQSRDTTETINALMQRLEGRLVDDGLLNPISESFTLAGIWDDLCQLTGTMPPARVLALLEGTPPVACATCGGSGQVTWTGLDPTTTAARPAEVCPDCAGKGLIVGPPHEA